MSFLCSLLRVLSSIIRIESLIIKVGFHSLITIQRPISYTLLKIFNGNKQNYVARLKSDKFSSNRIDSFYDYFMTFFIYLNNLILLFFRELLDVVLTDNSHPIKATINKMQDKVAEVVTDAMINGGNTVTANAFDDICKGSNDLFYFAY